MQKQPENIVKGMNLYGQLNYHQSLPNLAWPNNAMRCNITMWFPYNKCARLFMQDDYNACDHISQFIYIDLSEKASGSIFGIGIKMIRINDD